MMSSFRFLANSAKNGQITCISVACALLRSSNKAGHITNYGLARTFRKRRILTIVHQTVVKQVSILSQLPHLKKSSIYTYVYIYIYVCVYICVSSLKSINGDYPSFHLWWLCKRKMCLTCLFPTVIQEVIRFIQSEEHIRIWNACKDEGSDMSTG